MIQAAGDSIGLGETRNTVLRSPIVFGVDQKGTSWRATVRATVKDPLVPEPPTVSRTTRRPGTSGSRARSPTSRSPPRASTTRRADASTACSRGSPGKCSSTCTTQGEVALTNWSYDVDLVNLDTGQHTPLWTQVAGSLLPVGQYASYEVFSPVTFNEGQKNSHWRVDVHAAVRDPLLPEPPDRQSTIWRARPSASRIRSPTSRFKGSASRIPCSSAACSASRWAAVARAVPGGKRR